jgi:hypothetical protein
LIVGVVAAGLLAGPPALAEPRDGLPPLSDPAISALRTVCDLQWVDPVCTATGYADPQYRTSTEPDRAAPLATRIGIVHEHSGYSDGDPRTRPADYFRAARDGHNVADVGGGDTAVQVDYLLSSEHSENEKLPVTTAAVCFAGPALPASVAQLTLEGALPPLACSNVLHADHYRKWDATLRQAAEATEITDGRYVGFTAMRGFEFTNDYFNHLGVYFSRNVRNAKIDGSYASAEVFWSWLRRDPDQGGGADALVVFNHPGGPANLTPFDDGSLTGGLVGSLLGGTNWHDYAYVPDVDAQVSGMEVNSGDDLGWYVTALTNGWHLGAVAGEDEHQREWSSTTRGKTAMLTRGRSPRDYYFALQHNRTTAYRSGSVTGSPGSPAQYPRVDFWADGTAVNAPGAAPLGSRLRGGPHTLEVAASALRPGAPAVLVRRGGPPIALGTAGRDGRLRARSTVQAPATGEGWWFVVVCSPGARHCGQDDTYQVVTSPIWVGAPAR